MAINNAYTAAFETLRKAETAVVRSMAFEWFDLSSNRDLRSGALMAPLEYYPQAGSTLMDVRSK